MKTAICPTCGCSLVRLGISKDESTPHRYDGMEYRFCCQGCLDLFITEPQKYLQLTSDLVVCPTCLAEKALQRAVESQIGGHTVHFCGCPYCVEAFQKNPDFYMGRLAGRIPNKGVLDHEGCCVRPD